MPSVLFACFIRSVPYVGSGVPCPTSRTAIGSWRSSSSADLPWNVHQLVGEFEQLIAAGLDHPVIAAPLAAGIEGVTAYLAQDYVTADSLDIADS